ncbi:MAG: outer membrane lipoprotein carrier protein LolA [Alphaproteobacteria bacterium]|nr:outer membrane lipoprotein carrier protein LolA [Alphaproteobacteria bacterium]
MWDAAKSWLPTIAATNCVDAADLNISVIPLATAGRQTYLMSMIRVRHLARRLTHQGAKYLLAAALLAGTAATSGAQEAPILDEAAKADVARIEQYLNALTTLDSRFVQFSGQGIAEGRMFLSRPGDMRIEYEPPVPILMVASGFLLMYHDRELLQTTYLPVSETPAAFLLEEEIKLSGNVAITGYERGPASIRLTILDTDAPDAGSVTFTFEDKPLRLAKWQVKDAQGNDVDVALLEPKFGVAVDDELFSLIDPTTGLPNDAAE